MLICTVGPVLFLVFTPRSSQLQDLAQAAEPEHPAAVTMLQTSPSILAAAIRAVDALVEGMSGPRFAGPTRRRRFSEIRAELVALRDRSTDQPQAMVWNATGVALEDFLQTVAVAPCQWPKPEEYFTEWGQQWSKASALASPGCSRMSVNDPCKGSTWGHSRSREMCSSFLYFLSMSTNFMADLLGG